MLDVAMTCLIPRHLRVCAYTFIRLSHTSTCPQMKQIDILDEGMRMKFHIAASVRCEISFFTCLDVAPMTAVLCLSLPEVAFVKHARF
jgi:hypothetical protein